MSWWTQEESQQWASLLFGEEGPGVRTLGRLVLGPAGHVCVTGDGRVRGHHVSQESFLLSGPVLCAVHLPCHSLLSKW